jgi:hypothetical protein
VAIPMRLIQQYHPSHKQEFHALEKQFVELERRGVLPRGERLAPISGREAMNTIVWQCRFESLCAAEAALKQMDSSTERIELARQQHPMFQQSWVEFYDVLDY